VTVTAIDKRRRSRRATAAETRRAVGYIRISALMGRTQGEDLLSDEIQRERVEAWARFRGVDVVGWYVDLDVSGRKGVKRPEFDRMLADAKAGAFDTVVVYRLSRFARIVAGALQALDDLEGHGVTLVSVSEDLDTSTSTGKPLRTVLLAMDEFQSDLIGESWRHVHANRRARGIAQVNRMFGYETNGTVIVGVNEGEAEALRSAFELRARGGSTSQVAKLLHDAGFKSKRSGSPFIAGNVLRGMLRNPVYAGLVPQSDGSLIDGQHPAIVSRDLFDRVQATWRRTTTLTRTGGRGGSLSGLLVCSGCGRKLTSEGRRYRCKAKENGHECACPVAIDARGAEAIVEAAFWGRFDLRRMPNNGKVATRRRKLSSLAKRVSECRRRADELTRALDTLADDRFVVGTIDAAEYQRQHDRFVGDRQRLLEEAAELEAEASADRTVDMTVRDVWEKLDAQTRRRIMRPWVARVTVAPAGARGRHATPLRDRLRVEWAG
jgi:DNA invertase Pin-like site-specific DNA recombinase